MGRFIISDVLGYRFYVCSEIKSYLLIFALYYTKLKLTHLMSNNPVLMRTICSEYFPEVANFFNRYSIPHTTNNVFEHNRLFSREGLVSCLEDSVDEIPNHSTTSTSIDLGTSSFTTVAQLIPLTTKIQIQVYQSNKFVP